MAHSSTTEQQRIPLRIRLPYGTEEAFIESFGANVTRGGLFIDTSQPKPVGTALSFELVLQDNSRVMRGEGVVHRAWSAQGQERSGMLVRFTRIDARTKALIDRIIDHHAGLAHALPPSTNSPARSPHPTIPPPRASPTTAAPKVKGEVVLGIDLGTTTCRAAVIIDQVPHLIPFASERGSYAMPSAVAFDPLKNRLLLGSAAKKHRVDRPEQTAIGFKRLLGKRAQSQHVKRLAQTSPYPLTADADGDVAVTLGGRTFSVVELTTALLKEIKNAAQDFLGRELKRAVVCVPAWYSDHQRGALINACHEAGLESERLLNEPTAVALAFGYGRGLARRRVLVYDLGGGTFDASVLEITGDDLETNSTGGDHFLGGLDFDARLADALLGTMHESHRAQLAQSRMATERVRDAAEVAKITLSEQDLATVRVPFATTDSTGQPVDLHVEIERGFLEAATGDLLVRTEHITRSVLEAAKLTPQSLDEILLVGGQSRAPAVRLHLEKVLGRAARTDIDPAGVVALGAAWAGYAAVQRERGQRGNSVAEVLAVPIGVAAQGGAFRKILESNTRLPAEKSIALTVTAGQALRFAVLQGTSARAEENEYLGALAVQADQPGELQVHFAVSRDGRLTLQATTPTGRRVEAQFVTQDASDAVQAQLFAESPLPGELSPPPPDKASLFGGFRKFLG